MVGALENYANPRPNQMDYCELLPLVNNLQLLLSSRLAAKGIELECFIPEGLLIYVDKMHLIQILINLINNSIDAFNEPGTIRLLARQDKGMAIILVEDDGEGIAAANLERIFEPFFTTRQSGTGLGLYICNQLAIANSGSIQVKQREPKGTRIEIILIGKEREGDNGDG